MFQLSRGINLQSQQGRVSITGPSAGGAETLLRGNDACQGRPLHLWLGDCEKQVPGRNREPHTEISSDLLTDLRTCMEAAGSMPPKLGRTLMGAKTKLDTRSAVNYPLLKPLRLIDGQPAQLSARVSGDMHHGFITHNVRVRNT